MLTQLQCCCSQPGVRQVVAVELFVRAQLAQRGPSGAQTRHRHPQPLGTGMRNLPGLPARSQPMPGV